MRRVWNLVEIKDRVPKTFDAWREVGYDVFVSVYKQPTATTSKRFIFFKIDLYLVYVCFH